jgi:hypothetical protein
MESLTDRLGTGLTVMRNPMLSSMLWNVRNRGLPRDERASLSACRL